MRVLAVYGKDDLATVTVLQLREDPRSVVETVESIQPPLSREAKWVVIISTMIGCPVRCKMCDAGE